SKDFRKIKTYRQEDGYNGEAFNMLLDDDGNLWFTNNLNQISRLNTTTGLITTISETDGYQKQNFDSHGPAAKDEQGKLYFGFANHGRTTGGLDRIYPEKYSSIATSSVYLLSLTINQKHFSLPVGVNNLENLSLRYNQNTISIETGIIDFYANGKGRIRYKLKSGDKDEDWQYGPAYYTIRYEKLPPGNYELVFQASNAGNEYNGPEKIISIIISPPFWETWWFRIAAAICIIGLIYGLLRWRLQHKFRLQLERSQKEKQLAELQQQKTELEMQALRAQMNPHFIFNSLNSINGFILQNNKAQASEYLTKFSRLVRLILQNSQAALITLENELEALNLYLELEEVRFDDEFEYKIRVDDELDVEVIKVPPLIIQPYAENAIWHGLMHKKEKGHLEIELYQEEELLCFKITDDGIGRKKAAELKSKSASTHKSMGMRITADRIAILQQKKQLDATIVITDLTLPDGSAGGTEVLLKIPVML
ncbi:MAG: histidine kinase, partial [Chitinophagaceae bacterium]